MEVMMQTRFGTGLVLAVTAALVVACDAAPSAQDHDQNQPPNSPMIRIPESIASEHRELHEILGRASQQGGQLGVAGRELEHVLAPHFEREEEIASPPLGLLPHLAQSDVTPEMKAVLPMTDALERELPRMLREHDAIRKAVTKFRAAAVAAEQPDYVAFADHLAAHARQEEEILYPSAILVGRYIKHASSGR
jgi:hypothetical protein